MAIANTNSINDCNIYLHEDAMNLISKAVLCLQGFSFIFGLNDEF